MGPPLSQFEGRDSGLLDSVAKWAKSMYPFSRGQVPFWLVWELYPLPNNLCYNESKS